MSRFDNSRLQRKLTIVIMLTTCAALLLACASFVIYDLITFRQAMSRNLATLANVIGATSTAALAFDDPIVAGESLSVLSAEPRIVAGCIYNKDGSRLATYVRAPKPDAWAWPVPTTFGPQFVNGCLDLSQPILLKQEQIGAIYLRSDLQDIQSRMKRYGMIVLFVLLASLFVALLVSARLQRVVSDPILRLAQVAEVVTVQKDYSIRAEKHSTDETGLLIDAFNQMLTQIQERDVALRIANGELEERVEKRTRELQQELAERMRAEERLEESENRLRTIFDSEPECVKLLSIDGGLLEMNAAGLTMIEADSLEAVRGQSIYPLIAPDYRLAFIELHGAVFRGEARTLQFEIIGLKDTHRWMDMHAVPLRNAKGEVISLLGVTRDITERRRAEQEVQLLQSLTLIAGEASNVHEALGLALQKVCRIAGWKFGLAWIPSGDGAALECDPIWHSIHPGFEGFWAFSGGIKLERGQELPGQVWANKQPGWLPDISVVSSSPRSAIASALGIRAAMAFPVLANDKIVAVLEFFTTETRQIDERLMQVVSTVGTQLGTVIERKQAEEALNQSEEQLRQAQKMEAVGRLAGGVAHDFNNILTVINGYADLTLRSMEPTDPHRKSLEEIQLGGERAAGLTRQLLAFSRKQVLQPKVLDLNETVASMTKLVHRLIGEDIHLYTAFEEDLGRVKADPGQIEQVILNLAVNARDAMPRGGKLTIATDNVSLDQKSSFHKRDLEPGEYVMLSVSDNGVGMTDFVKAHLFEPFFTTKGPGKGTGLGLATCYGIVKQSGGDIRVYSEPDQGTTFKVYLPRVDEIAATFAVETGAEQMQQGTETVLVVEDESAVRELASFILRECGYRVLEAENGERGLDIVRQHAAGEIDLLITDVIMPRMGGKELVERVEALRGKVNVLFISGYTDDALAHHGVLDEGIAFLEKPFTPARLAQKVRELLDYAAVGQT